MSFNEAPLLMLSLGSNIQTPATRILPHQPTRISARPVHGAFDVRNIIISQGFTDNGAADWIVNSIEIDGRPQFAYKDLPGELFRHGGRSHSTFEPGRRERANRDARSLGPPASAVLSFRGLDIVECGHEFALVVTYIGSKAEGAAFCGYVDGTRPPQRPTIVPISTSLALPPAVKTTLAVRLQNVPFRLSGLKIDDGCDWIIDDLRIDSQTQFGQYSENIPGDAFSADMVDMFVNFGTCPIGGLIEIDVRYIGSTSEGHAFVGRLIGTVPMLDDTVPPPDLQVIVETAGEGPGAEVIGTCDWRPPATSNRNP